MDISNLMNFMKDVKVIWIDSCASNSNWVLLEDIDFENLNPIYIETIGKLLKDANDYIVIAQNYGKNPEQVCNLMTIPKGCIKEIKAIEF